jgi:hypothetical protein
MSGIHVVVVNLLSLVVLLPDSHLFGGGECEDEAEVKGDTFSSLFSIRVVFGVHPYGHAPKLLEVQRNNPHSLFANTLPRTL